VLVHTGGLQGVTGFLERFPNAGLRIALAGPEEEEE
jgi:hypothetical protein